MITLAEIEKAAEKLLSQQKPELMLFLGASVLLAASGSDKGASREVFQLASRNQIGRMYC